MSIECGECEHDLRGGHAPGCSRYVQHAPTCQLLDDEEAECTCDPQPKRQPQVVFECEIGFHQKARVVAVPYKHVDGVEGYAVEMLKHHASMGEPVWERVRDVVQLERIITCMVEKCPPYAEIEELRCAVNAEGGIVENVELVNGKVEALLKAIDERYET